MNNPGIYFTTENSRQHLHHDTKYKQQHLHGHQNQMLVHTVVRFELEAKWEKKSQLIV